MKIGNIGLSSKLANLLMLINQRVRQLWKAMRAQPYLVLLFAAIFVYGIVFSYFTVLKHNLFQTNCWDLGVFDQALYTTLHNGKLFYYTADLFLNPAGCFFAQHVSPILFLVLPFYAVNSSPVTLLVFKSFVLAFGALPLYLLAKELLESTKASFIVAVVYLLYVPLQGANWFDFQPQIFLPLLFFSMFYFAITSKWKLYFFTTALAAMVEEHISLLIFLVAAYLLITSKVRPFWQSLKSLRSMNRNLASVITLLFSVIYFFVAGWIKNSFPINPQFIEIYKALHVFSVLGVKADPILFPLYILFNPQRAFAALLYDFPVKFLYLILLFGPLLFLSLKSKVVLITVPFLGLYLFSNFNAYYSVGAHYPLYILAFIFVAALFVLKRLQHAARMSVLRIMLIVSMLFTISVSPLSPLSTPFVKEGLLWGTTTDLVPNEHTASLDDLLNVIPPNASVLTQNTIFSHVSNRPNAYVIPLSDVVNDLEYMRFLINSSEYILIDLSWNDENTNFVLDEITNTNSHGAYALALKAILFKRGFQGTPVLGAHYTDDRVFSAYSDLSTSPFSRAVSDSSAVSGKVVLCPMNSAGHFVYGPSNYLLRGSYEVTFTVKVGASVNGRVGGFDITSNLSYPLISERDIFGFELQPYTWTNFTLTFTSTKFLINVEFRTFSYGTVDMYLDRVIVKRVSPNATSDFGMRTFGSDDLSLASGYATKEGFLISQPNTTSSTFWYGPYVNLTAGRYKATVLLNVTPLPQEPLEHILTLSISATGGYVCAIYEVRASDFLNRNQTSGWQKFALEFIARDPLEGVEFAGLAPSSNFTISLAYILIEKLVLSPDINYELFSVKRGLQVATGQIVSDISSNSGEVALSRKGLDEGMLVYGPYITLPSGNYTAVFRLKTSETLQNASIRVEVVSQPDNRILSRMTLNSSKINDGSWFNVTLPFSLETLTANIEFRVSGNGMTNLYVDTVMVFFP
jgi:uncharacterized membrane protein